MLRFYEQFQPLAANESWAPLRRRFTIGVPDRDRHIRPFCCCRDIFENVMIGDVGQTEIPGATISADDPDQCFRRKRDVDPFETVHADPELTDTRIGINISRKPALCSGPGHARPAIRTDMKIPQPNSMCILVHHDL